jgi:predicted dehydrogenase
MTGGSNGTAVPRLAVIGAGVMGSYHARVIAQSQRCDLIAIIDPDDAAGKRLAERHGVGWRPEVDHFDGVDAVVIAAPTETHPGLVHQALANDVPVLVEKPVTEDLAETERLVATSERCQVPLMCGFVERYNPAIQTLMTLGVEPVHVTAVRHSPYSGRIRTGVSWDLLIHDVDICLRMIEGEPAQVRSGLGRFHPGSADTAEDVAEAVMTFPTGIVSAVSASRIGQRKIRSITIAELSRSIEVDLLRRDVTIYRHVSHDSPAHDGRGYRQQTVIEIPELVSAREPLAGQLDRFLDLVAGSGDMKEERDSILPAHHVVDRILSAYR